MARKSQLLLQLTARIVVSNAELHGEMKESYTNDLAIFARNQ